MRQTLLGNMQVQQHMDLGTLLHHVDHHMYPTCAPFLADLAVIPQAWRQYHQASHGTALMAS